MSNQVWAGEDLRYVDPVIDAELDVLEDHNEEIIWQTTFTNNGETTALLDVSLVRNGRQVIVTMPASNMTLTGTPDPFFVSDIQLPVDFQPSTIQQQLLRTRDAVFTIGFVEVSASLEVFLDVDSTVVYTAGSPRGWGQATFTYMLN